MNIKIHIHPKYEKLSNTIKEIPNNAYTIKETFCNKRNTVELVNILGYDFVVKKYRKPNIFNRIIYTFFRKSKACRAYEHALTVLRHGVSTPFPVAYIETKKNKLFHTGYFISEYMPYPVLGELFNTINDKKEYEKIKEDFIDFTIRLHEKGILPLDYNSNNIFYYKENEHYKFALTDINRAKFGKSISKYRDTMISFEQLGVPTKYLFNVIVEYTSRREMDLELSLYILLKFRIKKRIKKFIKKKLSFFIHKQQ